MAITLKDVANKAGVSIGTASQVLNGSNHNIRISDATRRRVFDAASDLNYRPNSFAKSLRTKRSGIIGVCAAYVHDQYTATILQYVNHSAHNRGYRLMLSFLEDQANPVEATMDAFGRGTVDGILIRESAKKLDDQSIVQLHRQGIKVVLIGREITGSTVPSVTYDNYKGGSMAAEHLLSLGHRKIAVVMPGANSGGQRKEGACDAIRKYADAQAECIDFIDFRDPGSISKLGYDVGQTLASKKDNMTAIIAYDDALAFGIIRALRTRGIRVPEDVAVVGFDDMMNVSAYFEPPLTSIRPPYADIGEASVRLLIDLIEERVDDRSQNNIVLEPTLIVRESSGVVLR